MCGLENKQENGFIRHREKEERRGGRKKKPTENTTKKSKNLCPETAPPRIIRCLQTGCNCEEKALNQNPSMSYATYTLCEYHRSTT